MPPELEMAVPAALRDDGAALLDVGRRVVAVAEGMGGDIEAYVEHSLTTTIKVYEGKPESIVVAEPRGLGVRFIREGRLGYAYTSDLSEGGIGAAVDAAVAASTAAGTDEYVQLAAPPQSPASDLHNAYALWSPELGELGIDDRTALAVAAETGALADSAVRKVEKAVYTDADRRVGIVSSRGIELWAASIYSLVYVYAHAERGGEVRSGLAAVGGREGVDKLQPEAVGKEAAEHARRLLGAKPCSSGRYVVVLDREVTAALISALAPAFSADAVQKGRSVFAGKEGQCLAPSSFRLWDDGVHPLGPATFPFDDEGVVRSGRTAVVQEGRLSSFLYDSRTAAKAGVVSTGNAGRSSYRVAPMPGPTNLVVEAEGQGSLSDLVGRVGEGLYVCDVSGLHSGINNISGEISVGISGHLIRQGRLCEPVREVTIATDVLSLLSGIVDAATDNRWDVVYGGVLSPSIAIEGVAVSGA
ncbi:MAG: TldD/PmbA family protein [Actinobacteria bacterium]|nr:TldD/PmbA family protein [Actinomycetota bacterium]